MPLLQASAEGSLLSLEQQLADTTANQANTQTSTPPVLLPQLLVPLLQASAEGSFLSLEQQLADTTANQANAQTPTPPLLVAINTDAHVLCFYCRQVLKAAW